MKVKVSYLVRKEVEVELTEAMVRGLYNKNKHCAFTCTMIEDEIHEYLEQKSGCLAADGEELEYDVDVESWIWDLYDKIREEEY